MSHAADVPDFVALIAALLVVIGASAALLGSIGLLRLKTFYERVHAPTLGVMLGTGLISAASIVLFSALQSRPVVHEILICVFMFVTTPMAFVLLVRAALHRDRVESASSAETKS